MIKCKHAKSNKLNDEYIPYIRPLLYMAANVRHFLINVEFFS